MSAPAPTRPVHPGPRPATPSQLSWLRAELAEWQREGLVDASLAATLAARYHPSRRLSLGRLLLGLGAAFVGVGLVWLVAANLDQLHPAARFVVLALVWLALLAGAEGLDHRRPDARAVVGSLRLLGALALGAVVLQAAQSLQVPAYEPHLVGVWAAGALVQAYAVRAVGPLLVGVAGGATWFVWQVLAVSPEPLSGVLALGAVCVLGLSVAALHGDDGLGPVWREVGAAAGLAGLFVAALPFVELDAVSWSGVLVVGLVVAAAAAGVAVLRSTDPVTPLAALVTTLAAAGLVLWEAPADPLALGPASWLHAGVAVAAYVVAAVGVAVLGTRHDSWRLTALANVALVGFTTFQSFAVFATIIQGAWLFLALGLVLLGTGVAFDRVRRGLVGSLA